MTNLALSNEWLIAIGVGLLLLGVLIGYLVRLLAFGGSRKEAELSRALGESEQALADYKNEVLERFSDTADKFRALNESYVDLHQQLAESAVALCGDDVTTPLLEARRQPEAEEAEEIEEVAVQAEQTLAPEATEAPEPAEPSDITVDGIDTADIDSKPSDTAQRATGT